MSKNRVTFYFAYNSPYAFLANTRIDRELATLGVDVDPVPVYRPRAGGGGPDMNSPRMRYIIQDVARFAEAYGLDIDPGPFSDTGRACRGYLFAKDAGGGTPFYDRVYEARWLEGKDIGDAGILAAIADRCGLDGDAFRQAIDAESPCAARLEACNEQAEADGVFGFPFFSLWRPKVLGQRPDRVAGTRDPRGQGGAFGVPRPPSPMTMDPP